MTVYQLQKDMAEEIADTLSDMLFQDAKGTQVQIKVYCQNVPKKQPEVKSEVNMEEREENEYPSCVVRAESGQIFNGGQRISIVINIAIFSDDIRNQGQEELLNIFHKIAERFIRNPVLKDKYRLVQNEGVSWELDDKIKYPYFIGRMAMKWDAFFVEMEEDNV